MSRNGSGGFNLLINSWNPAINGVSASASDWQALIDDVAAAIQQSVSADGQTPITGNLNMGGNRLTNLSAGSATGQSLRFEQLFSQGIQQDIAAAATVDIGAALSTLVNITGAGTITSFGTNYNGPRLVRFAGVCTLTNSGSLVLPGGANITTEAGDGFIAVPLGNPATGWRLVGSVDSKFIGHKGKGTGGAVTTVKNKLDEIPSRADYDSDANYNTARNALSGRLDHRVRVEGGTTDRLLSAKLGEIVSIKDFGAVGDDSTNDRAAIQAAIDYAVSLPNGGTIFFPAGIYRIDAALNVPSSKSLILEGQGDASKIRFSVGAGAPILNCGDTTVDYSTRLVIRKLFFQGPPTGTSNGILLSRCNTSRIEECIFQNQVTGIESQNSFAIELSSNVFDVCSLYGFIATTACHNAIIERNNFFTCQTQGVRFNVLSDNLVIDNNNFEFCGSNIRINNCTAVSITGNYIEFQSNACFEFLGTCRNVAIERNWIALGSGGGATTTLQNIQGGVFRANTIFNQTVSLGGALLDFEIGNNYKFGTGTMAVQNWVAPTLLNSWANQVNYFAAGYRKDINNIVHLRGNLSGGAAGTVVFNLPAGYRPGAFGTFATLGGGGATWIEVRPNGDVFTATAPSNLTALNGIYFKAEA